jgi:hypothetical protein
MSSTLKRLAAVAVGALGTLVPMASASAATTMPVAPLKPAFALPAGFPAAGLPAFKPLPLTFVGPSVGQVAAVIGPTVLTTAPSNFSNTNIQVSAGGNLSGGQAGI